MPQTNQPEIRRSGVGGFEQATQVGPSAIKAVPVFKLVSCLFYRAPLVPVRRRSSMGALS